MTLELYFVVCTNIYDAQNLLKCLLLSFSYIAAAVVYVLAITVQFDTPIITIKTPAKKKARVLDQFVEIDHLHLRLFLCF